MSETVKNEGDEYTTLYGLIGKLGEQEKSLRTELYTLAQTIGGCDASVKEPQNRPRKVMYHELKEVIDSLKEARRTITAIYKTVSGLGYENE